MDTLGVALEGEKFLTARLKKNKKAVEIKLFSSGRSFEVPKSCKIISGLEGNSLILRKLTLQLKNKHTIRKVLPFQAEAAFPYPPEEMLLVPYAKKQVKGQFDVTLFATTKTLLKEHLEIMHAQKIDPDQVSCSPAALLRFTRHFFPEEKDLLFLHISHDKSFGGRILNGELEQTYAFSFGGLHFSTGIEKSLSVKKEIDRTFSFLQKKHPAKKLLITGENPPIWLKEFLETTLAFELLSAPHSEFALPIGLGLEGFASDGRVVEFRQGSFLSPRRERREKKLFVVYLLAWACLTVATLCSAHFFVRKQQRMLSERLFTLPQIKTMPPTTLDDSLEQAEVSLQKEKKSFPFHPTCPSVRDFLAWISTHPQLAQEIDIKEVRYELAKCPKIGSPTEPYLAKVQLKFTSSSPQGARLFREILQKGDKLVDSKREITWDVQQNTFTTSFFLKKI